jgi:hypothetical protein
MRFKKGERELSLSRLVEKYIVSFAVFFILNVPDLLLRRVFSEKNGFRPLPPPLPPQPLPQPRPWPEVEIVVGPPRVPIAEYSTLTRIEYVPDRFLLDIRGPVEEVVNVVERLPSLFNDLDYDLDEMVRYVEINFPMQPIDVKEAVKRIRALAMVKRSECFSDLVGGEVGLFSFSLSFPETPLTLKWFHLRVEPDVNSPNSRVLVSIIKREEKVKEGFNFLAKIPQILSTIKKLLEEPP